MKLMDISQDRIVKTKMFFFYLLVESSINYFYHIAYLYSHNFCYNMYLEGDTMRVLVSGGGTGGHFYPALAIARCFKKEMGADILYVGGKRGVEYHFNWKNEGIRHAHLSIRGINRKIFTLWNIYAFFEALTAFFKSFAVITEFKPDLVIGTGGYVCGPVLLAAYLMGKKIYLQEQNVYPGLTTRLLSPHAKKIFLAFKESIDYLPKRVKKKCVIIGNPIRDEFFQAKDKDEIYHRFNMDKDKFTVLVFGGSKGAKVINDIMLSVYSIFDKEEKNIQFVHITGLEDYPVFLKHINLNELKVNVLSYSDDIYDLYAIADLVICRSGALTISEIVAARVPSILIPYPYAAEHHQEYNAALLSRQGAGLMIKEEELSDHTLIETIRILIRNKVRRDRIKKKLGEFKVTSASEIVKEMVKDKI